VSERMAEFRDDLLSVPEMNEDRAAKLIMKAREPWFSEEKGE